ncbi:MAG: aminoacyl-tRNA hydrolase [Rhodospirillaceae bacterium]
MHLLVGLGNPGSKYSGNRHNVGFMAVNEIHRRYACPPYRAKFQGEVSEANIGGDKVLLLKPSTYMNESGSSVGEAARFYKIEPADVIVIHDEIDLAAEKVRVKEGGGLAGHNGLKSIASQIGQDFWRVRIGVGHPGKKDRVSRHVLNDFSKADMVWVEKTLDAIAETIPALIQGDGKEFTNKLGLILTPPRPKNKKPEEASEDPSSDESI